MTILNAKFPGRCRCGSRFEKGSAIEYDRHARAVVGCHACRPGGVALGKVPERKPARRSESDGRGYYTRFSSGAEVFRNARGRCEDAPCCGCCS